jgi:hypothetical protein
MKEGFNGSIINMDLSKSFCKVNNGFNLESECNKLIKNNCNLTSCCVFTSENKCVAGNKNGPLFNSNSEGKTKILDYYYFQDKCYGKKCK